MLRGAEACLAGFGSGPPAGSEWHVVAVMEADFAREAPVRLKVGIAVAKDLGSLIAAVEVEVDAGARGWSTPECGL